MERPTPDPGATAEALGGSDPQENGAERYVLRLYVTGMTQRSSQAIATIKSICEEHLKGCYELEVVDIYKYPVLARDEQIIATPTLVKKLPTPLRRFIGDLSDREKVLLGLDLRRIEE